MPEQASNGRHQRAPATGLTVSRSFADEVRGQRQDALFQLLLAFVLSVAETLTIYLGLSVALGTPALETCLGQVPDANLPWMGAILVSRSALQPLNVCAFAFGVTVLLIRLVGMRSELQAFYQPFFDGIPLNEEKQLIIGEPARAIPLHNVRRIAEQYSGAPPLLVRRMEGGSRRLADGGDAAEVHAVMQALGDIDRGTLDSRYTLLRYLTWLIPTVGFLGTVVGMGMAISGFGGVISGFAQGGGEFQARLQPLLASVAQNLGVAFDTTLLALFLSAILVALTSVAQMREEALLSSIDEFSLRHFISRIVVPAAGTRELGGMLEALVIPLLSRLTPPRTGDGEKEAGGGVGLRDIAGTLAAQTEHLKGIRETIDKALARLGR